MDNSSQRDYSNSSVPLNPSDFWRLDHEIVMMILENYHELISGAKLYSTSDDSNSETQRANHSYRADFETSCLLAAEVSRRVRLCGLDGMICEERYGLNPLCVPKPVEKIAEERRIDVTLIVHRINKVAWYCVGRNLRKETYEEWKNLQRWRRK